MEIWRTVDNMKNKRHICEVAVPEDILFLQEIPRVIIQQDNARPHVETNV